MTHPTPPGQPRPGDTVRVVRTITTTEVFEGTWLEADASPTGNHGVDCTDGTWRRVRDQGPVTFGPDDATTIETDTIEVIATAASSPVTTDPTPKNPQPAPRPRRRRQRRDWRG